MMEDLPRRLRKRLIRFPVSGASVHSKVSSARLAVKIVAFSAVCTALVAEYVEARAALLGSSFLAVSAQCGVTFFF